jgi:uncharacterized protein (TIGR03545 family)
MSTAGSARNGDGPAPFSLRGADLPPADPAASKGRSGPPKFFRWRGIFALIFGVAVVVVGWILFGDRVLKSTISEAATKSLGAQVDIGSLHLSLTGTSLELRDVAVAHPFDPSRNVIEIRRVLVKLEGRPLLEKKIVISDVIVDSVRGLTHRKTPARPVAAGGFLPGAMREASRWSAQFKVPLLSLTPIDTIRSLILDPGQLQTVQKAKALATRADSIKDVATARFKSLRLTETADSAQALLASLKGKTPRALGINGTRTAIADVRRFAARVDSTRRTLDALRIAMRAGLDSLIESAKALDESRQADYEFARGLLKLPTFDAPNIGPALFGQVSIDAFERAMYWVMLAREYAPPGILPREQAGPKRLRRSGTTVHFVKQQGLPRFHLKHAVLNLVLDSAAGAMRGAYALRIADVTSDPAIVKRPTAFSLTRTSTGAAVESLLVVGSLDHTKARQTETIVVRAGGVTLPKFAVPAVPLRLDMGKGASSLRFNVAGDSVTGSWTVASPHPAWQPDPARRRQMNTLEGLVTRVLTGIQTVDVAADIRGTTKTPRLSVRSNLDRAVADNIKRVAGEEISTAEAKVRQQVDAFVDRETAPAKAKIAETRADIDQRIADATAKIEKAKADLAARLKELTSGLIG